MFLLFCFLRFPTFFPTNNTVDKNIVFHTFLGWRREALFKLKRSIHYRNLICSGDVTLICYATVSPNSCSSVSRQLIIITFTYILREAIPEYLITFVTLPPSCILCQNWVNSFLQSSSHSHRLLYEIKNYVTAQCVPLISYGWRHRQISP
jgi:hypothetical protein